MPKISIITTTYKHQNFIAQTIESVLAQTFIDWELLIWDDSPDDETWNIIQKYVEKYPDKIKAWHHKPNKWIVENMNFLLSKVSKDSEYIAFLEGDDMFTSDNLEKRIEVFENNLDIWFVYSDYKNIDEKSNIIKKTLIWKLLWIFFWSPELKQWKHNISLVKHLKKWNFVRSFGCVMIKKDIFLKYIPFKVPDNQKMFWPLDYFLWLQILHNTTFYHIKEPLLLYRLHNNNFSSSDNLKVMYPQVISIYDFFAKKYKNNKKIVRICEYIINRSWAFYYLHFKNKRKAFSYFMKIYNNFIIIDFINKIKILFWLMMPKFIYKIVTTYILKNKE